MTRVVIEGTSGNLTVVRPNDLPQKANHSFLRYCDIRGRWANRSLGYVDIVDCKVSADFSRTNIGYLESFRSDWDEATLSTEQETQNVCNYDIRTGMMVSLARSYTGISDANRDILIALYRSTQQRELTPRQLVQAGSDATGMSRSEIRDYFIAVISAKPHLTQLLSRNTDFDSPPVPKLSVVYPAGRTEVPMSEWRPALRDLVRKHDRWRLARGSEQWMDTYSPENAPWICRWDRLWPTPNNTCEPEGQLSDIGLASFRLGQNAS